LINLIELIELIEFKGSADDKGVERRCQERGTADPGRRIFFLTSDVY